MSDLPKSLHGIPLPDFLNPSNKLRPHSENIRPMPKHQEAYDAFCKWAALPHDLRHPKNQAGFETKWNLSPRQTSHWKEKDDFQAKRLNYFWNWMFDKFPDVVYAIYRRAKRNSSADAKVFADLIGKRLEISQPKVEMKPLMIMGIPQEKIDNLFIPKNYDKVVVNTTETFKPKIEEAEVLKVEQM